MKLMSKIKRRKSKSPTYNLLLDIRRTSNRRVATKLQKAKRDLFSKKKSSARSASTNFSATEPSTSKPFEESWYCAICDTEDQLDMRLCSFCLKYFHENCIENKATDKSSIVVKEQAWKELTDTFNAVSTTGIYRDKECLKRFYENRKSDLRNLRKIIAKNKQEMMKTGGGPENQIELDAADKILITIVNQKSVEGLINIFDSDIAVQCKNVDEPKNVKGSNKQEFYLKNMTCLEKIIWSEENENIETGNKNFATDQDQNKTNVSQDFPNFQETLQEPNFKMANDLRLPKNPALKVQSVMEKKDQTRRPEIQILASSHIAQKYDELLDQRKLLLQKQIESINQDLAFQEIKNKLEIDILNIKLAREKQKQYVHFKN
ncbi:unnamed protein product [Ceutorhynchus assimilis]|uniref:Regulatory protein zeste n=1 Tax=Ceutorhynchus assimilis TaxID=467358 RepID=A0A9N9QQG8_9CUCU|nr:unnamed protein product [Ceutorhynchus assimilis]